MTRTVYRIQDMRGETIAEHVRVEMPGGKKQMYWQSPGCDPSDGLMGIGTADLPLYGTEQLAGLDPGRTVVIAEGERAANALRFLGLTGLGTVTGASGVPGEDALGVLLPFDVVLWPDFDEPGEQHMGRVAARLTRLGGRARRLVWAGAREKGDDAADFVKRGGTRVTADLMIQGAESWAITEEPRKPTFRPYYVDGDTRVEEAKTHLADVVIAKLGAPSKQDGRSLWWCCPFHSERTASFKVDRKEPYFVCFGCGARGDVFAFLQRTEGTEFRDALRELAPPKLLGAAIPW